MQPTAPVYFLGEGMDGTGRYIVILKEDELAGDSTETMIDRFSDLSIEKLLNFERLHGFVAPLTDRDIRRVSRSRWVDFVEEEQVITFDADQVGTASEPQLPWGLDRIDQVALPLDNLYTPQASGSGVDVYIVDTGIHASHEEFLGRMGASYSNDEGDLQGDEAEDCNGHGTHVAGTAGGSTYGVAPAVTLHSVKVTYECTGSMSTSDLAKGFDWVANDAEGKRAVANFSATGWASPTLDLMARNLVDAGITVVVAAGNDDGNACSRSPAREPSVITVGSSTQSDARSSFSNWGSCVDVFAPGSKILSAGRDSDRESKRMSGTSMASPHVAGVAALYLETYPDASVDEVAEAISGGATPAKLSDVSGSPNLIVNTGFIEADFIPEESCANPRDDADNSCGAGSPGDCYCDDACEHFQDCCDDYWDVCF